MWDAATAICVSYVSSTLPTLLDPIYQKQFHFSPLLPSCGLKVLVRLTGAQGDYYGRKRRDDNAPTFMRVGSLVIQFHG
jgi:hypothetical protein